MPDQDDMRHYVTGFVAVAVNTESAIWHHRAAGRRGVGVRALMPM
jgi:hypothetical protein